jgi:hypothetical protein
MTAITRITMPHDPHELFFPPAERWGSRVVPAGKIVSVLKPFFVATVAT